MKWFECEERKLAEDLLSIISDNVTYKLQELLFEEVKLRIFKAGYLFTGQKLISLSDIRCVLVLSANFEEKWRRKEIGYFTSKVNSVDTTILDSKKYLPEGIKFNCEVYLINKVVDLFTFFASKMNNCISDDFMNAITYLDDKIEDDSLNNLSLDKYRFMNEFKEYVNYRDLIVPTNDYYKIAPESIKISNEYKYNFKSNYLSAEQKISLIQNASEPLRHLALKIVVHSDMTHLVSLKNDVSWIRNGYQNYMKELSLSEIETLEWMMQNTTKPMSIEEISVENDTNVLFTLNDVQAWWTSLAKTKQEEYIAKYRKAEFGSSTLSLKRGNNDWYRLLFLAILKSKGRTTPAQNKRFVNSFINNFEHYKDSPVDRSQEWIEKMIFDDMHDGIQYEDWRKFLPFFGQVVLASDHLYDAFTTSKDALNINNYYDVLNYRQTSFANGADLEIPNLKACLGHNYPLILRELLYSPAVHLSEECREDLIKESFFITRKISEQCCLNRDPLQLYRECKKRGFENDYPIHLYQIKDKLEDEKYDDLLNEQILDYDDYIEWNE